MPAPQQIGSSKNSIGPAARTIDAEIMQKLDLPDGSEYWFLDWKGEVILRTSATIEEVAAAFQALGIDAYVDDSMRSLIRFRVGLDHPLNAGFYWLVEHRRVWS